MKYINYCLKYALAKLIPPLEFSFALFAELLFPSRRKW